MRNLQRLISTVAQSDATVLITGETGTGKELVARAIHCESPRRHGTFVAVNCAAIHPDRMEDNLFGHVKGAFTGAIKERDGYFVSADGGTIFLDEIGDMSMDVQTSMLRTLQERTILPVGADRERSVDVRVVVATKQNVEQLIKNGKFREDLYYRLNVITIPVPPLRERKEDIPLLAIHFLNKYKDMSHPVGISDEAMQLMSDYDWPGNVRELEHTIQRAIMLTMGDLIQPSHLSLKGSALTDSGGIRSSRWPDDPVKALFESFKRLVDLGNNWNMLEDYLVALAMSEKEHNSDAARLIGMHPNTLQSKKEPIKKALKIALREKFRKQGKNKSEIEDEIGKVEEQLGDLKTAEQRRKLTEIFPLYTENF